MDSKSVELINSVTNSNLPIMSEESDDRLIGHSIYLLDYFYLDMDYSYDLLGRTLTESYLCLHLR